jgi:LysM repeat protein
MDDVMNARRRLTAPDRPTTFLRALGAALAAAAAVLTAAPASAQSLRGSPASLDRQNQQAVRHEFTYLNRRQDVARFVDAGLLVPLEGSSHYQLTNVSFKVARPEVRLFVERLSVQYYRTCGSPLVVTSLTRPKAYQPSNASARSVHPTGMALDLRVPTTASCRRWLESTLLSLEARRVLDVTLERNPPHYHVALFPGPYVAYVAATTGRTKTTVIAAASESASHTVKRGETLWRIAQTYDTTPAAIRRANRLTSTSIRPGQRLLIPSSGD